MTKVKQTKTLLKLGENQVGLKAIAGSEVGDGEIGSQMLTVAAKLPQAKNEAFRQLLCTRVNFKESHNCQCSKSDWAF